jgi:hypothetical protein
MRVLAVCLLAWTHNPTAAARRAAGGQTSAVTVADDPAPNALRRRGFVLGYVTLGWNVAGIIVLLNTGARQASGDRRVRRT